MLKTILNWLKTYFYQDNCFTVMVITFVKVLMITADTLVVEG